MKKDRKEYFRRYREENRERLNAYHRKWTRENREKVRAYKKRYKAKKKGRRNYEQLPGKDTS